MSKGITYIGLDAHHEQIVAATLRPRRKTPETMKFGNNDAAIRRFARKVRESAGGRVVACYEAGPTGFYLQRQLLQLGIECVVIAPSLIPAKPGERIKTDHRDAKKLAELLRAGLLTEVRPPTEREEAVRDLCRAREDAKLDGKTAKQRLGKFLMRRGVRCEARAWTIAWWEWVRSLEFEHSADQDVLESYVTAVEQAETRTKVLDDKIKAFSEDDTYRQAVGRLRCFRGIDVTTAMVIVTELHGFERFQHPRQLMAYLGLVPSERSSGNKTSRGAITKAGNSHARRALIEAAWHYRHQVRIGHPLKKRREGQDISAIAIADKAMRRLHKRWTTLVFRGKPTTKATTAVARELTGFIWATLTEMRAA